MVRISKQSEKRQRSPRKHRIASPKTGPLSGSVSYKPHPNALQGEPGQSAFIPKIK